MKGMNPQMATLLNHKVKGFFPNPLMAVSLRQKQFINHGITSVKFQTVSKGHRNIANSFVFADDPEPSQRWLFNEHFENRPRNVFIEMILVKCVKLLHEVHQ